MCKLHTNPLDTVAQVAAAGGQAGENVQITYTEADGSRFAVSMILPQGLTLRAGKPGVSVGGLMYCPVYVCRGDEVVGEVGYNRLAAPADEWSKAECDAAPTAVWQGLGLGSMYMWELGPEFAPLVQNDEITSAACRVYHNEGGAGGRQWYTQGVLSYSYALQRTLAVDFTQEDAVSAGEAAKLAMSVAWNEVP